MFRIKGHTDSPVIYMDLDTVVMGDLWPIIDVVVENPGKLIMLRDFYHTARLGSGLMGWSSDLSAITEAFKKDSRHAQTKYYKGGDQAWLMEALPGLSVPVHRWQDSLQREVISYKVHVRGASNPPPGATVCCFHGQPRPWNVDAAWIKEAGL
jgi:hypothetical protein